MKRTIMTCLMAVGLWLTAMADNTVRLTEVKGHPGEEVEVAVVLTNTDAVTAFEVLIPLGDMLRYVEGSAVLNAERSNGHALSAAAEGGKLNICIYNVSLAALKGSDGELCRFKVKLGKEPADYTLVPEVVMSDAGGRALANEVENGMVTLLSPKIEVVTPVIDYARVPIRGTYDRTLSVKNVGNEPLEITGFAFDNEDLSASPTNCTIAAGSTQGIVLSYAPMQRGTVESNVAISSNAINPKAGKATVKAQPFSVNELHVQRVEGVSDEEVAISLKMNNMEPIAAAQCSFTLPSELVYVEGSAAVGERCVGTDHRASGSVNGDVLTLFMFSPTNATLPEGDGELMTFKVKLDGKSGWYKLDPKEVVLSNRELEDMTSATSGEYVIINSPTFSGNNALDFGRTPVTEKATATYSIYNSGKVDLAINKVTFLAEGYSVETELPMSVAPSQTKELVVGYRPKAEGEHKTTMQLYTNDPVCRMKSVVVSGTVFEPNSLTLVGENQADGTYDLTVGMTNYTDIVAVQMDVHWLKGMTTSSAALEKTARLNGHTCTVADIGNGVYRVVIFSMNNTPIADKEGALFTLTYTPKEGVSYRDTQVQIKNVVLSDKGGANYTSVSDVSSNATFTGFTLKFIFEGETLSEQFIRAGSSIAAPEVPAKEGHTFSGWGEVPQSMPANDVTFTGSYTVNQYDLVYMVDGQEYKRYTHDFGTDITVETEPEKEGHTFSGWSVIPDSMPAENVTVVGSFSVNKYAVTYILGGEVFKTDSIAFGAAVPALAVPSKAGYNFSGWGEIPASMPSNDITLHGSYTINKDLKFSLIYVIDGAEYKSVSLSFGDSIVLDVFPVKEGHTFSGWSESPATVPLHDVVVEGSFTANVYTVTFVLEGETFKTDSVTYGTVIAVPEVPAKEGHTFSGWSEVPTTMPAVDITVAGTFAVNTYAVAYIVDGEVVSVDSVAYGSEITVPAFPEKEGHTFSGWSEVPTTMPAVDITVTGTFVVNTYAVAYIVDGEVVSVDSVAYGSEITVPAFPEKEGHTFSGWSEVPATMPAEDVAVVGSFAVNTYNVYYYVGDILVNIVEVEYGGALPEYIYEPTSAGETFVGWDGCEYENMPAHDVVFTALVVNGVEEVVTDVKINVYTLQGGMVMQNATMDETKRLLPKGIYIVNGKKYIIK